MAKAALAYARQGWSVVPLRPRDKRPLVRWEPLQHRAASLEQVRAWFAQHPDANVGLVTGAPGGLVVIDVDPRHGGDGSLTALEREHGPLPPTVESLTGGGGRHLFFAHPGAESGKRTAVRIGNRTGIAPGIDVRGDGGYVVVPPSIHPSGRAYAWRDGHDPGRRAPAPIPAWLLELVTDDPAPQGHPLTHWRELARTGVREGERNTTIASFAGHLLWRGVDPEVVLELLQCWNAARCEPPLSAEEVARTVASIVRLHERQTFP